MGKSEVLRRPYQLGPLAAALAFFLCAGVAQDAQALALGRVTVLSALGEPLRAEIDIPEITAEEAATLRAGVAAPDAFRAAGLEYSPSLSGLQISLQKRSDGRSYLRLSNDRAVNDPFVDLILEANWSAGRIVRDYTLLFDPSNMRPAPVAALVPAIPSGGAAPAPSVAARNAPVAPLAGQPAASSIGASRPASSSTVRPAAAARAPAAPNTAKPSANADAKQITVKAGDTAGKIAAQLKPESISLDQMLLALLRANPDAFVNGNVNRIKAGAVLDVPDAAQANATPAAEASKTIVAQSRDFNEFRRKLAGAAPQAQVGSANREAAGKVQAKVEERKTAAATPDKLTLSKGAVQAKSPAEDKIAKDRQAKEATQRVAELSKNISDLSKFNTTAGAAPAGTASTAKSAAAALPLGAAVKPAVTASAPAVAATPAPAPVAAASAPKAAASSPAAATPPAVVATVAPAATPAPATAPAPLAALAASAPANTASAAVTASPTARASAPTVPKAVAAPVAEPSLVDELLDNPFVLPAAGGLVALLGGFAFFRSRQRKKNTQVDSSFLESRLQPDSFFGASGGQRIDTSEGAASGSSMVYSPSQLDAAGDVDPVAEADVYLAYGRDLQAEEILKEAMRINPSRVAIHGKLMEIYAKRRDAKAFELVASEAFSLTGGDGPEWENACQLGRDLEPSNPLYQPGGKPGSAPVATSSGGGAAHAFGASTIPQSAQPELAENSASVDFDLDLDFSLGDEPAATPVRAAVPMAQPTMSMAAVPATAPPPLDMDFGAATVSMPSVAKATSADTVKLSVPDLAFSTNGLSFTPEPVASQPPPPPPAPIIIASAIPPAALDSGMIEFDLGLLSLDLDPPTAIAQAPAHSGRAADPLETKLALATEFYSIGDSDGARALAEEVVAHASGPLKAKAQKFLAELA